MVDTPFTTEEMRGEIKYNYEKKLDKTIIEGVGTICDMLLYPKKEIFTTHIFYKCDCRVIMCVFVNHILEYLVNGTVKKYDKQKTFFSNFGSHINNMIISCVDNQINHKDNRISTKDYNIIRKFETKTIDVSTIKQKLDLWKATYPKIIIEPHIRKKIIERNQKITGIIQQFIDLVRPLMVKICAISKILIAKNNFDRTILEDLLETVRNKFVPYIYQFRVEALFLVKYHYRMSDSKGKTHNIYFRNPQVWLKNDGNLYASRLDNSDAFFWDTADKKWIPAYDIDVVEICSFVNKNRQESISWADDAILIFDNYQKKITDISMLS
jgi:hypothetical protein